MKPLSPGLQVEGLQVQALLARLPHGFVYQVTDKALGRAFELEEFAPGDSLAIRRESGDIEPAADAGQAFEANRELFLEAARLKSRLDNPALPQVLRVIEAHGTVYALRPAREGRPVAALRKDGKVASRAHVREALATLADGLQALHDSARVHGGLNTDEVWLDAQGRPYLKTLGMAEGMTPKSADPDNPATAPEALQPDSEITPRSDCYSLAATLLEWLSGEAPPPARQRLDALAGGGQDPLDLITLRREGGMGDLLSQALELDPDNRPERIASWAESLSGIDARLSMLKEAQDAPEVAERRPWGPLAIGSLVTVLMIAAGIFLISNQELPFDDWFQDIDMGEERDRGPRALAPTDEEEARWNAALDADTLLGYRQFMEDFPRSVFGNQAQLQIDILDERAWETLSAEDTRPAYVDYLEDFPTGLHQADALRRIEAIDEEIARLERERLERERLDNEAWTAARDERTIESMQGYINEWPAGLHIDEAQKIRRQLSDQVNDDKAMATARQLDTKASYRAYIDAFPQGQHITEALESIDRLTLTPGKPFRDCPVCPELRVMPIGAFAQGATDDDPLALAQERPQRLVSITRPFAVGIYEVTMGQWDACVEAGGCSNRPSDNGWGRGDRPVIMVSWNDAQEYVAWLSAKTGETYRLPSESEWEYFARADARGPWPDGDPAAICTFGNIAGTETGFDWQHDACGDSVAVGTVPVGVFPPNRAGLFDVIGNVAEWTADCLNLSYLDAPTDGSAWTRGICSSHMTRGGSWVTGSRDIRLSSRFNLKNGDRNDFTGFRVVREIREQE